MLKIPHHEFWPARWYELPGYIYLGFCCAFRLIGIPTLFRANYGLDHGGASFASKLKIQEHIGAQYFPPTVMLPATQTLTTKSQTIKNFVAQHGYPVILKPDYGFTGRGVFKIDNEAQLQTLLPYLQIDYLAQAFVSSQVEFGVFYLRYQGQAWVSGINQKHFPTVVGDGQSTLRKLVEAHPRYNHFWHSYLPYHNLDEVLPAGQKKRLSVIGSHTMGCMFTEDTHLLTSALEQKVCEILADVPGVNYGRLDFLADSVEDFQNGRFTMVECNGVDALPTNIFDPKISVWHSYRILFYHFKMLAKIGYQHRKKPMDHLPMLKFRNRSKAIMQEVSDQQDKLETMPDLNNL